MSLIDIGLAPLRRLMHPESGESCFICRRGIQPTEERIRLRADTVVHRRCATYRMRNRRSPRSGAGFPG